jgi:hypothetical protein
LEPYVTDFQTKQPIDRVLIAGKNEQIKGAKLPVTVYIAKINDAVVIQTRKCSSSNIEVVTSGNIFSTNKEASAFAASVS